MTRLTSVLPLLAMVAWTTGAPGATASALQDETAFVQSNCAACHATGAQERVSPLKAAIPFAELAGNPAVSALALRVMLQTSHRTMPNLSLTPDQTAAVIAYILNLRGSSLPISPGLTQINDRNGNDSQDSRSH